MEDMASINISMASWSLRDFWIRMENQKCKYCITRDISNEPCRGSPQHHMGERCCQYQDFGTRFRSCAFLTPKSTLVQGTLRTFCYRIRHLCQPALKLAVRSSLLGLAVTIRTLST